MAPLRLLSGRALLGGHDSKSPSSSLCRQLPRSAARFNCSLGLQPHAPCLPSLQGLKQQLARQQPGHGSMMRCKGASGGQSCVVDGPDRGGSAAPAVSPARVRTSETRCRASCWLPRCTWSCAPDHQLPASQSRGLVSWADSGFSHTQPRPAGCQGADCCATSHWLTTRVCTAGLGCYRPASSAGSGGSMPAAPDCTDQERPSPDSALAPMLRSAPLTVWPGVQGCTGSSSMDLQALELPDRRSRPHPCQL